VRSPDENRSRASVIATRVFTSFNPLANYNDIVVDVSAQLHGVYAALLHRLRKIIGVSRSGSHPAGSQNEMRLDNRPIFMSWCAKIWNWITKYRKDIEDAADYLCTFGNIDRERRRDILKI
jgi:plasmid stabilization system protein ParE